MFKKSMQLLLITGAIIALMACSTARKHASDDAAVNDANAAYQNEAQSSGLGDDSNFGDQADGEQLLSKRIYYFAFDSNVVHEGDKSSIAAHADYLMSHHDKKIIVEGHTDPRGSREYNIALGERRAKAVAQILREKGVSPAQIRIVSYGAQKLASMGRSEADYQQDRRVVLVSLQS